MKLLDDIDVLVLDLDDTLYLECDYVVSGFHAVAAEASRRGLADLNGADLTNLFDEGVRANTFNLALERRGITPAPELVRELVAIYRRHHPSISLLPDAERLLERTPGKHRLLITDGPAPSQRAKIAALDLEARLDHCIVTAELGEHRSKPDPTSFELVETLTGRSGAQCVYVGDNPHKDFTAPAQLGWRTVRVRRPKSLHVDAASPAWLDAEITSLDDL